MKKTTQGFAAALAASVALLGVSANAWAVSATTVGFDGGSDGGFTGNAFFEATGGNPNGNAHFFLQTFGLSLRTGGFGEPSNPGFLGDYSQFGQVSFSFDVQVNSITDFFGGQLSRAIGITLIDNSVPEYTVENTDGSTAPGESIDVDNQQTITLVPQQNLQAEGKAARSYQPGKYSLTITAALPALEDEGYYEAYLNGAAGELLLGRVEKQGATYRLDYTSHIDLSNYQTVKIVVDGPRDLQNQPIPLPFDILAGDFSN